MADTLRFIQALLAQHGERRVIAEYIKMRLRQRKSRGWEVVNNQLRKKIYFSKLKVQNLRQFIPYSREQQIEEANRYLQKKFVLHLEEHTTRV